MMHYATKIEELSKGKDSIFEPCTVMEYDPQTMLAKVYGVNSRQMRDNVPVLFPAMYLNSGIISPPVKEATGMLFWGSENQPYLMPGYFLPPAYQQDGSTTTFSSSPKRIDDSFDLSAIEGGEHLFRSHGGAYIFLKNLDEVEIGTGKLHKLALHGSDGTLETIAERTVQDIGGYRSYNGPFSPTIPDHVLKVEIDDTLPTWHGSTDDKTLVQQILSKQAGAISETAYLPIFEMQAGNVYDGTVKQTSALDAADLFFRSLLYTDGVGTGARIQKMNFNISKLGGISLELDNDRYQTVITIVPGSMTMTFTDSSAPAEDRTRVQHFGY
jgi:hypothetical protein